MDRTYLKTNGRKSSHDLHRRCDNDSRHPHHPRWDGVDSEEVEMKDPLATFKRFPHQRGAMWLEVSSGQSVSEASRDSRNKMKKEVLTRRDFPEGEKDK